MHLAIPEPWFLQIQRSVPGCSKALATQRFSSVGRWICHLGAGLWQHRWAWKAGIMYITNIIFPTPWKEWCTRGNKSFSVLFTWGRPQLKSKVLLIGKKGQTYLVGLANLVLLLFFLERFSMYLTWLCKAETLLSLISPGFFPEQQFSETHHLVWPVTDWTLVILKMSSLCLKGFGLAAWQKAAKSIPQLSLGLLHASVEPRLSPPRYSMEDADKLHHLRFWNLSESKGGTRRIFCFSQKQDTQQTGCCNMNDCSTL